MSEEKKIKAAPVMGPYHVVKDAGAFEVRSSKRKAWGIIARIKTDHSDLRNQATAEANANLLAASWEMLEALRAAVVAYEQEAAHLYGDAPEEYFQMRAAIAKAEGRSG